MAAAYGSSCTRRRQARLDYTAAVNVRRLPLTLLMSFVLLAAVQLPQPAQAAVIRIPTGRPAHTDTASQA